VNGAKKTVVILMMGFCIACFASPLFLDEYYSRTSPREPQPKAGRAYLHYVKTIGYTGPVYLTRGQKMPYDYFWYLFGGFGLAAHLLNQHWRCFAPFRK
jgi:hypothetical protein